MFLLNVVEADDLAQSFASPTRSVGNIRAINIGGCEETRVISSPLMFQATLAFFFLPSLLVGGFTILRPRGVWGLVLYRSLFGRLVSSISSQHGLGLSLVEEVVSSVPSN